jgi:hypothetical protein
VRDDLVNCGILERRFGALGVRVPVEDPKSQVTMTGCTWSCVRSHGVGSRGLQRRHVSHSQTPENTLAAAS